MSRFTGGWIKLHRNLSEKDIVQNPFLFSLWIYLLLIANYKESQIIWLGKQRILLPGQCWLKMRELSDKWDCSPKTIWKWLHYLQDTGRLVAEAGTRGTIVTICNWKEYQITSEDEVTLSIHQGNTEGTQREHQGNTEGTIVKKSTIEEEKKGKKERRNTGIRVEYPTDFEAFWKLYGMKGDKKASFEEYKSIGLTEEESKRLPVAIRNYQIQNPERKFRKDFQRFLKMDWRDLVNPAKELNGIHPKTQERLNTLERYKSQVENLENGGSDYES